MLEDEEEDQATSREVDNKWGTGEVMDTLNDGLYYKVTVSGRKECDIGGM